MDTGVRIYEFHLNIFAYTDDLSLVSTTADGLQSLMNICHQYAETWTMKLTQQKIILPVLVSSHKLFPLCGLLEIPQYTSKQT